MAKPKNTFSRAISRASVFIRSLARVHIDIPTLFVLLVILVFLIPALTHTLFSLVGYANTLVNPPSWFSEGVHGIAINVISAIIIVPAIFWILGAVRKSGAVGTFAAFEVDCGQRVGWGHVVLTYSLFTNRIIGILVNDDIELEIEGRFERGQYLRGIYIESSNSARRRCGAFLLELDGNGNAYNGTFSFVGPTEPIPKCGKVYWERIS